MVISFMKAIDISCKNLEENFGHHSPTGKKDSDKWIFMLLSKEQLNISNTSDITGNTVGYRDNTIIVCKACK